MMLKILLILELAYEEEKNERNQVGHCLLQTLK